jgi:hypothetical protein
MGAERGELKSKTRSEHPGPPQAPRRLGGWSCAGQYWGQGRQKKRHGERCPVAREVPPPL